MDAKLKKQVMTAVGVVLGTFLFTKYVAPTLEQALPNKGA